MNDAQFLAALPVERRLALSYAPAASRRLWLGLFALDARLSGIVSEAREPMLAQIKLAWWREELSRPLAARRKGEPLLELLGAWGDDAAGVAALADGWETLLGGETLSGDELEAVLAARAAACRALAARLGLAAPEVEAAARGWAAADLAAMGQAPPPRAWPQIALPREMRPLQVLYGLAARGRGQTPLLAGPVAALAAVRLGLLGI